MSSQSLIEIKVQAAGAEEFLGATAAVQAGTAARVRTAMVSIFAILVTLVAMEGGARWMVALGKPAMFATKSMDAKVRLAELSGVEKKPRVVFLGSSIMTRAVYPELINERWRNHGLSATAYNLGSSGVYPMDELFLLRTATENASTAPVSAAVVEVTPWVLAPRLTATKVYSEQFKNSYEGALLATKKSDPWGSVQSWLARSSYLVRYRSYLASVFRSTLDFVCDPRHELNPQSFKRVESEVSPHGWSPSYLILTSDEDLQRSIAEREARMQELFPAGQVDKANLNYSNLDAIAEYCNQHRIRLAILWLPMHPAYFDYICRSSGLAEDTMRAAFAKIARRNNAKLIDLHSYYAANDFADCDHLNVFGAMHVSPAIADALNVVSK